MKLRLIQNLFLIIGLTASLKGYGQLPSQETALHDFDLKTCHLQKCLTLKSKKAIASQFTGIFAFNQYTVVITNDGKNHEVRGDSGYIDFDQEVIVVQSESKADYLINLKTLEEKDFSK